MQSCGTVFKSEGVNKNVQIKVSGEPSGGAVSINGANQGVSPNFFNIKGIARKPIVQITKEGYYTNRVMLKRHVRPGIIVADVVFGFVLITPIFILIDHFSGGLYKLKNKEINYDLKQNN